jgi:hypothetical protein
LLLLLSVLELLLLLLLDLIGRGLQLGATGWLLHGKTVVEVGLHLLADPVVLLLLE